MREPFRIGTGYSLFRCFRQRIQLDAAGLAESIGARYRLSLTPITTCIAYNIRLHHH